jgi:hypothetical protein
MEAVASMYKDGDVPAELATQTMAFAKSEYLDKTV